MLVATLCYIVAFREKYEYVNGLLNIVFVVIGYYFGSKREKERDEEDDGAPGGGSPSPNISELEIRRESAINVG